MTHMSDEPFDKRVTPLKDGVTDQAHEGLVRAKSYVAGEVLSCYDAKAPILSQPEHGAEQWDQLLLGERFKVIERKHDFYWGQALRDGYVGYVPVSAFRNDWYLPTHYVSTLRTYVFAAPNVKASILTAISLNALVSVTRFENGYAYVNDMGWVFANHLSTFETFSDDFVSIAEGYINAPYQWGGRESIGLDCSGLLQQSLYASGYGCPRDSDMQAKLGLPLMIDASLRGLTRGDLVFWKGHVAIMVDDSNIIHANAHHMKVAVEPLADAVNRIDACGTGMPTAFRRL